MGKIFLGRALFLYMSLGLYFFAGYYEKHQSTEKASRHEDTVIAISAGVFWFVVCPIDLLIHKVISK